jgi:hypothetical protein
MSLQTQPNWQKIAQSGHPVTDAPENKLECWSLQNFFSLASLIRVRIEPDQMVPFLDTCKYFQPNLTFASKEAPFKRSFQALLSSTPLKYSFKALPSCIGFSH